MVSQQEYVEAFYTGAVFKLERLLLAWFVSRPSSDAQAKALASGVLNTYAAWRVEARSTNELLMCDVSGRTSGQARMGFRFKALLGFHKLYSRILLYAARSRLARHGA